MASDIRKWKNKFPSIRLSQIIDMYYSNRGVVFDSNYKACDRISKIKGLFDNVDLAEQVRIHCIKINLI